MPEKKTIECTIVNELSNTIDFDITKDERGVTIHAIGPTSEVEHTWTPVEAITIRELLITIFKEPDTYRSVFDHD